MLNNVDCFHVEAGKASEMFCKVCGVRCSVRRNVYGPTSWASAIAKHYTYHDAFTCPYVNEDWHKVALDIFEAIGRCPSKRVAGIMKDELQDILKNHPLQRTKKGDTPERSRKEADA